MTGKSTIGAKSWCRVRRISRILLGTTTTRLLGSGTVGISGAFDIESMRLAVADSRNIEGCPYGRYVDGDPFTSPDPVDGPGELVDEPP